MIRRFPLLVLIAAAAACATQTDEEGESGENALNEQVQFRETTGTAIKEQGCDGDGCYTNYALTADLDGDGKFDLIFANGGHHFFPTDPEQQIIHFGEGNGTFTPGSSALEGAQLSIVRQVAVADFDGDGKLDLYMPSGYGTTDDQLFIQKGNRKFVNEISRIAGGNRSTVGGVHAGDIDNDGDIDLVIADWGSQPNPDPRPGQGPISAVTVRILENDGTGRFTQKAVLEAPGAKTSTDIDLQDINGDFNLDIVLTARNDQSHIYLNDGTGKFTNVTKTKAFPAKQGPFTFNAEMCDFDGDGDLDLAYDNGAWFVGGGKHSMQIMINDGSGKFTDETATRVQGDEKSDDNQVKCVDFDNDGDFDLIVGALESASERYFQNIDGKGHFKRLEVGLPKDADPTLAIDAADFDGDGKVDLLTAQGEGQPATERIFKNLTANSDKNKPIFRSIEKPKAAAGKPTVLRLAVSDAHTSETGQHVRSVSVEIKGGATIPARFVGGDVFRAVIPAQAGAFKVIPHAVDRQGNEAVGAEISIAQ